MIAFELSPADINSFDVILYEVEVESDILRSDKCGQHYSMKSLHYSDQYYKRPVPACQITAYQQVRLSRNLSH